MSFANDYKGISDRVTVIAATTGNKTDKIRVAAYCRVSTDKTDQVNSFLTQMRYYTGNQSDKDGRKSGKNQSGGVLQSQYRQR